MKFKYDIIDKLPPLAWLAKVTKDKDEINVVCGNKVECHDSFCVSGIWEGDFPMGEISNAISLQGTGLQIVSGGGNLLYSRPYAGISIFHKRA